MICGVNYVKVEKSYLFYSRNCFITVKIIIFQKGKFVIVYRKFN